MTNRTKFALGLLAYCAFWYVYFGLKGLLTILTFLLLPIMPGVIAVSLEALGLDRLKQWLGKVAGNVLASAFSALILLPILAILVYLVLVGLTLLGG